MARIVRDYARTHQVAISLALTDADTLSNKTAEGASTDVLITAKNAWLAELKQQGLVDVYSETPLASDHLSLVAPEGVAMHADFAKGFPTGEVLAVEGKEPVIVLGYPGLLPEATPAREALKKLHADNDLEPYIVYLKDRKLMRDTIRNQHAFGILLMSDAAQHHLNVVGQLPDSVHPPIDYKAVVMAGDNMDEARRFIEFLKSEEAKADFSQFGFGGP
jgi:molybdate transport system substrate-binding protein